MDLTTTNNASSSNNTVQEYTGYFVNSNISDAVNPNSSALDDSSPSVNIRKMTLWFIITGSIMALVLILWCVYMFMEYKDVLAHNWQHFWGHPGELHFTLNRFRLARMMENRARMFDAAGGKRRRESTQVNNDDKVDNSTTTHILLKGMSNNNA